MSTKNTSPVFEGTVAGQKFLFKADVPSLTSVAEIPKESTAAEIALANSLELVARAKANHTAVRALYREWVKAKKVERNASPEAIAAKAAKEADRSAKLLAKAEAKAQAKAEKLAEKARIAEAQAKAKLVNKK